MFNTFLLFLLLRIRSMSPQPDAPDAADAATADASASSSSSSAPAALADGCDMPWDRWQPTPMMNDSSKAPRVRAVAIKHNMGFIGNKLFSIAAGVALAETMRLPLKFPKRTTETMKRKGFPCLRSSKSLLNVPNSRIHWLRPNLVFGSNFQDVSIWGTSELNGLPVERARPAAWLDLMRRSIKPVVRPSQVAPAPAEDDLVIHFRDLRDCVGWKNAGPNATRSTYAKSGRNKWYYDLEHVYSPPPAFYEAVVAMHLVWHKHAKLWIVSQPCDRQHATVKWLAARYPTMVRFLTQHDAAVTCNSAPSCKSAVLDYVWLQKAHHVVLGPSTFGWWPAFLSETVETIHYPLHPSFSPWSPNYAWCHLIPEDDARYIFHDGWTQETWSGGGNMRASREARRRCDVYLRACVVAGACATSATSAAEARRALPYATVDDFNHYHAFVDDNYTLPESEPERRIFSPSGDRITIGSFTRWTQYVPL